jgi:hypothetical protein
MTTAYRAPGLLAKLAPRTRSARLIWAYLTRDLRRRLHERAFLPRSCTVTVGGVRVRVPPMPPSKHLE